MGSCPSASDCWEICCDEEECNRDRKCYVDQDEVKIGAYDVQNYPQGTKYNAGIGRGGFAAGFAAGLAGYSSRSTAAPSSAGRRQLQPQSVTWAEGLMRKTGNLLSRIQLTPKASSFSGNGRSGDSASAPATFEEQMRLARAANPGYRGMASGGGGGSSQRDLYRR
eukprot:TRINITY_DN54002_c0_g1_i1.p1 TRINITY_DN54002_c0_g1~~TRINITY_DN54002_c0_g1_i1.p1  ORF type:complete len:184 (+),score=33.26 TRINITY_DN54002_c0_g1_i1:57-554(+)